MDAASKASDSDFDASGSSSSQKKKTPKKSEKKTNEAKSNASKRKKPENDKEKGKKAKATKTAASSSFPSSSSSVGSASATPVPNKPKAAPVKSEDAFQVVLDYLVQQNRPYSYIQIFDNLHGVVKKNDVPKICDKLVADGKLVEFVFGKAKVYMADQSQYAAPDPAELEVMDAEVTQKQAELNGLKQQFSQLDAECHALEAQPTNSQADELIRSLDAEIDAKTKKLTTLSTSMTMISAAEVNAVKEKLKAAFKQWKLRKTAAMEMVNSALGESSKKPRDFLEERGCDTDEDAGVKMDDVVHFIK